MFDYKIKKRFLADFAFKEFFTKNRMEISHDEFDFIVNEYANKYSWHSKDLNDFVSEIEKAGILEIDGRVKFSHRSFLDYFVGLKLFDIREEIPDLYSYLTELYYNEYWGEAVLFFAGLKEEIPIKFLDQLLDYDKTHKELLDSIYKVLVGEVIQAAWHSESKVKLHGIRRSISYSENVVEEFLQFAQKTNPSIPQIYGEFYSMIICDMAYNSRFLLNENKTVINDLLKESTPKSVGDSIRLLWAIKDKLPEAERSALVNATYKQVQLIQEMTGEQYAKDLLLLKAIDSKDKSITKTIEKKVREIDKENPGIISKLVKREKQASITEESRMLAKARKKRKKA